MSIWGNITETHWINLSELAEQQKIQGSIKIKKRILKQTHNIKLAENLTPIIGKLEEVKESTKTLGEVFLKPKSEDEKTQTRYIEKIPGTQSLRDTLSFMKTIKNKFKVIEKPDGDVLWNGVDL